MWDKVVKNYIKLPSKGHGNTENTTQVERKSTHFLKTEYLQLSQYCYSTELFYGVTVCKITLIVS